MKIKWENVMFTIAFPYFFWLEHFPRKKKDGEK